MSRKGHKIGAVDPGSIAEALELEPGDCVLSIDGHELEDIFDYEYYINSEAIVMEVRKADGEEWELEIENGYEDLGITFENGLMSEYRSCRNKCINISVQTTNPELRCEMLHNRFAGQALKRIDELYKAGVPMNGQIVLCKGLNDGEELERTIRDLSKYLPYMESVSVVPVGLSKFRDGLYPLKPIEREDAAKTIDLIERWQKKLYEEHGTHFIHASDEFYILAGRPLPEEERYDGYIQLENGVGMLRLLEEEVESALQELQGDGLEEEISIATGQLAAPFIERHVNSVRRKYPNCTIHVYPIRNYFFGEQITVAGLVTGQDLIGQLKDKRLGSRLLLPECMFRSGEEVFLDDITRGELQKALQVKVDIVKSSGQDFVQAVLHPVEEGSPSYEGYELKEISYE